MVICPGIGNHSEQKYVRTFVDHSQRRGYRCAVLNHLGALPDVELTSPRMFTYGNHGNSQVQTVGGGAGQLDNTETMVLGKQWKQISQSLIQSFRWYLSAHVPLSQGVPGSLPPW